MYAGAKRVYVLGQLTYTVGVLLIAVCRTKAAVLILSATYGVMYATLFTLPFILVAHYHSTNLVSRMRFHYLLRNIPRNHLKKAHLGCVQNVSKGLMIHNPLHLLV